MEQADVAVRLCRPPRCRRRRSGTPPAERRWAKEVAAEPDPHGKPARYQQIGDVAPRITPLFDVLRATAPGEPEVAAFLAQIEHGRREGPGQLLGTGAPKGTWRTGLSPDEVADIVSRSPRPTRFEH